MRPTKKVRKIGFTTYGRRVDGQKTGPVEAGQFPKPLKKALSECLRRVTMKIFLASSHESKEEMHTIARSLEALGHDPLPWDLPGVFPPGRYTFDVLIEVSRSVDAAVFVFAEDDLGWYRGNDNRQPRDNVLIEYGLFAGTLGPERALICRHGQPKTASDLAGLTHIDISRGKNEAARAEITAWLARIADQRLAYAHPSLERQFVRIVTDNRHNLDAEYRERKYSARYIDIVSLALSGALEELASDPDARFLKRIVSEGAHARLMFLTPTSSYVRQRAMEDGDTVAGLTAKLREAVEKVQRVYERLSTLYQQERESGQVRLDRAGSLEVKVLDFCPHFTIYRTDETILWGIYTATTMGLYSSVLHVKKSHDELYQQLLQHFNSLWKQPSMSRTSEDSTLLSFHCHAAPLLNKHLVSQLSHRSREGGT
jgi:hypothetical protein